MIRKCASCGRTWNTRKVDGKEWPTQSYPCSACGAWSQKIGPNVVKTSRPNKKNKEETERDEWDDWCRRDNLLTDMETSIRKEFHRRHTLYDGSLTFEIYNRKLFWIDVNTNNRCIDLLECLVKITAARTLLDKERPTIIDKYLGEISPIDLEQAQEYIKKKYELAVTRGAKVVDKSESTAVELKEDGVLYGYEYGNVPGYIDGKKVKDNAKGRSGSEVQDEPVEAEEERISIRQKVESVAETLLGQGMDCGIRPFETIEVPKGENRNSGGDGGRSEGIAGTHWVQGGSVLRRAGAKKLQGKKTRAKASKMEAQGRINLVDLPDWEGHE